MQVDRSAGAKTRPPPTFAMTAPGMFGVEYAGRIRRCRRRADGDDDSVETGKRRIDGCRPDTGGPVDEYRAHVGVLTFFAAQRVGTNQVRGPRPSTR
jgi:hypothetical protein